MNNPSELLDFVFINSRTGNVIAYYSLTAALDELSKARKLELKRAEVAVENRLLISYIYWEQRKQVITI